MTPQYIRRLFALLALSLALLLVVSCDERNEADLPATPYVLKSSFRYPTIALDAAVAGDMCAIAASWTGAIVLDVSNPAAPETLLVRPPSDTTLSVVGVALDEINGLLAINAVGSGTPGSDLFPIVDIARARRIGAGAFSGPLVDLEFESVQDTFVLWGSDPLENVNPSEYCRATDTTWTPQCPFDAPGFPVPTVADRYRRFDRRGDLVAVACNYNKLRILDFATYLISDELATPGDPEDCAWHGNHILVADNYFLTVVDASDESNLRVVTSYVVPNADRLIRVSVDGNYAILLDDADGIYIVDITNPADPSLVQEIRLPEPSGFAVDNGMLVVTDEQLGVLIYQR